MALGTLSQRCCNSLPSLAPAERTWWEEQSPGLGVGPPTSGPASTGQGNFVQVQRLRTCPLHLQCRPTLEAHHLHAAPIAHNAKEDVTSWLCGKHRVCAAAQLAERRVVILSMA